MKSEAGQEQFTEKHLLENGFEKPIVLVTYAGNVLIKETVKVLKFDLKIEGQQPTPKLNVLFAFSFGEYDAIRTGIRLNAKVEAEKLQPIRKRAKRPRVATKEEYEKGTDQHVQITMRGGHVLSGYQIHASKYNLIVKINEVDVLVYKHGILAYQVVGGETEVGKTQNC